MKLVLNFKNNDVLQLDMKYVESIDASHKERGNGMILQYKSSELPNDFLEEYGQVLVRHNLSTHVGVFSFYDDVTKIAIF